MASRPVQGAVDSTATGCGLLLFAAPALKMCGESVPPGGRAPKGAAGSLGPAPALGVRSCPSLWAPVGFWVIQQGYTVPTSSFMPLLLVHWLKPTYNGLEFVKSGRVVNNLMFAFSEERQC